MSEIELDCSKYDTENQPPPEDPDNPFDL
jgi:hypothetical protein